MALRRGTSALSTIYQWSNSQRLGASATRNAWGKWNLHDVCSQLNFQRRLKRPRSKLDENDSAPVLSRLNTQDMSLIGRTHERTHGVSKLGAQLSGQKRSESLLGYRIKALLLGEDLIRHTLLLKGCPHITGSIAASHRLFAVYSSVRNSCQQARYVICFVISPAQHLP